MTLAGWNLIATVLVGAVTAFVGCATMEHGRRIHTLENRSSGFDMGVEGRSLIFTSSGDEFVQPEDISVEPIFVRPDVAGEAINVPADSGYVRLSSRSIVFHDLIDSICLYEENKNQCNENEIYQLRVRYSVKGVPDLDIVAVPQS